MGGWRRGLLTSAALTAVLITVSAPAGAAMQSAKKPKKPLPACKLLTVAEITAALGTAPTEPPKSDSSDECDYSSPTDYNYLNLSLSPLVSPALWKKEAGGAGATIPVKGMGDAAFRSPNNATIMVRKGKQTFRIDQYVQGLDETVIENLGKAVTARL